MTEIIPFTTPAEPTPPSVPDPLAMAERAVKLLSSVEQPSAPLATALALMEQVREYLASQQQGEK